MDHVRTLIGILLHQNLSATCHMLIVPMHQNDKTTSLVTRGNVPFGFLLFRSNFVHMGVSVWTYFPLQNVPTNVGLKF